MIEPRRSRRALTIALLPLRAVVAVLVLLDEIARPLYRPLVAWFSRLRVVARLEGLIARLPPYGVLALLAVPFAVVEPLKVVGLLLMAKRHAVVGAATLALAYLASFLLVERIYAAGRDALLTIRWFARLMTFIATVRSALAGWVGLARIKAVARELRASLRAWLKRARAPNGPQGPA